MKYLLHGQESQRLKFRSIDTLDFDEWLEFHKDPSARKYWIEDFQDPLSECEKWYQKQQYRYDNDLGGMNALIEKQSGKLIGHCGLLVQKVDGVKELEIGYSLLPKHWNKGFASEAAMKCRDFAFENNFWDHLISIISLTNIPSQKVAEKNGMTVSKRTTYGQNQVYIYRIDKEEWSTIV